MSYCLESKQEASRLEEQVFQENYSLDNEMSRFNFSPDEKVLDAGCGSGVVSRYLHSKYQINEIHGIDFSETRLDQARDFLNQQEKNNITLFHQNICEIEKSFYNKYDTVITRYVLEHLAEPSQAISQLYKCLKPGGRLIVLELDGIFFNLYSENEKLNTYLNCIKEQLKFDPFIGRKIPSMLKRQGFSEIEWQCELLDCQKQRRDEEYRNSKSRLGFLQDFLTKIFGSIEKYEDFKTIYLQELLVPENTLVFTKYYCIGKKL